MTNGSQREALQVVITALRGSAAVRALVGGRVSTAWASDPDAGTSASPSLVVAPLGGDRGYEGVRQDLALAVEAYSATSSDEALALYEVALGVVHPDTLGTAGTTLRVNVTETGRPVARWLEPVRLWCAAARWQAITL